MSKRFSSVFNCARDLYMVGAPAVIEAGLLHKDNETGHIVAQFKIKNICDKTITAATIRIFPKDVAGRPLGEAVTYQYLDLRAARDAEFGQRTLIPLPDDFTRAFEVRLTEVVFLDRTLWTDDGGVWESLPDRLRAEDQLREAELIRQYQIQYGEDAHFLASRHRDLWFCACGELNHSDEATCHRCARRFDSLAAVDRDMLRENSEARLAEEARQKEEAAARAAAEKQAARDKAAAQKKAAQEKASSLLHGSVKYALRLIAALLAAAALFLLFSTPWIRVDGLSKKQLSSFKELVAEEIEADRELLIESKDLDRELFEEAGVSLDKAQIRKHANQLRTMFALVTDAKLSPWELFKISFYVQNTLVLTDTLYEMEETQTLFKCTKTEQFYPVAVEQYGILRPYAPAVLAYLILFCLVLLLGTCSIVLTLLGKGRGISYLFAFINLLPAALFIAARFIGNDVLLSLDVPEKIRLALYAAPCIAAALPFAAAVLRSVLRRKQML